MLVGLDVSKTMTAVSAVADDGSELWTEMVPTEIDAIGDVLSQSEPPVRVGLETGTMTGWLTMTGPH